MGIARWIVIIAIYQRLFFTQVFHSLHVFVKAGCRIHLRWLGKCFRIPQVENRPSRQRWKRCQNLKRNAVPPCHILGRSHPLSLYCMTRISLPSSLLVYFTCRSWWILLVLASFSCHPRLIMLIVSNLGHHHCVYFLFPISSLPSLHCWIFVYLIQHRRILSYLHSQYMKFDIRNFENQHTLKCTFKYSVVISRFSAAISKIP